MFLFYVVKKVSFLVLVKKINRTVRMHVFCTLWTPEVNPTLLNFDFDVSLKEKIKVSKITGF